MSQEDHDEREEVVIVGSLVIHELMIFGFLLFLVIILLYGQSIVVIFYMLVCIAISFLFLWFAEKVIGKLEWYLGFTFATLTVAVVMMLIGLQGYLWLDYYYSSPHSKNFHAFFGVVMLIDFGAPGIVRFLDFINVFFGKIGFKNRIKLEREQIRVWKRLSN